jgi:hypothetical protein
VSEVKKALSNLSYIVGKLEDSVDDMEQAMAGQQRDMFASGKALNGKKGAAGRVLAERLDRTIEKVETLLQGGGRRG